jgi:hypothetical protein
MVRTSLSPWRANVKKGASFLPVRPEPVAATATAPGSNVDVTEGKHPAGDAVTALEGATFFENETQLRDFLHALVTTGPAELYHRLLAGILNRTYHTRLLSTSHQ